MSQIEQDTRSRLLCCFSEGFFRALREYAGSLTKACDPLRCCTRRPEKYGNSFLEIARVLSNIFRDLNVSGTDVAAGLVLLRKLQRLQREKIQEELENDTYQFLSGVAITPQTHFLDINEPDICGEIETITHYMEFALGVYGWPMFLMSNGVSKACSCPFLKKLRCLCCLWKRDSYTNGAKSIVIEDNCCLCNFAALDQMLMKPNPNVQVIYASYHVNVNETPFLICLDHERRTVVVSVRGTLSLQDVLTDLNADGEQLPIDPPRNDWMGHKGMVKAAEYIKSKLIEDGLLNYAFSYSSDRGTSTYDLVFVGHSLGAGTAAILSIILKKAYPNLVCYSYSPPGGTLSIAAVEATKGFITSVVLGKDVIPRIGLHQIDALRSDLMNAISHSDDPKWKIIMGGMMCCSCGARNSVEEDQLAAHMLHQRSGLRHSESNITLSCSEPLFPPGRIIHIVRSHPKNNLGHNEQTENGRTEKTIWRKLGLGSEDEPVYQAVWTDPRNFDKVLVSPSMIQDHMPDKVLAALRKVLTKIGPQKPKRAVPARSEILLEVHGEPVVLDPLAPDDDEHIAERVRALQRAKVITEAPKPSSSFSSLGLNFPAPNPRGAPLASPETLSEVSSVSGFCTGSQQGRRTSVIERVHSDQVDTEQCDVPLCSTTEASSTNADEEPGNTTEDSAFTTSSSILTKITGIKCSGGKVRISFDPPSDDDRATSNSPNAEVGWLASCSSDSPTTEDETQLTIEDHLVMSRKLPLPKEQDYDSDVDETASERSSQLASNSIVPPVRQYYYYDYYENGSDINQSAPTESAL